MKSGTLKERIEKGICLIPKDNSSHGIVSHEMDFCICDIEAIQKNQQKKIALLEEKCCYLMLIKNFYKEPDYTYNMRKCAEIDAKIKELEG